MKEEYCFILDTFERIAPRYGQKYDMEEANRQALAPLIASIEGWILDVGCGSGTLMEKYLVSAKQEIFTIDFSARMIEAARQRLSYHDKSIRWLRAFALALPFSDCAFDAVVCVNTIHNFLSKDDVQTALLEFSRVLKPEGKLILEFRNSYNLRRRSVAILYDLASLPQKIYSLSEMKKMMRKAGFEVQRSIPIFNILNNTHLLHSQFSALVNTICRTIIPWYAPCIGMVAVKVKNDVEVRKC